MLIGLYLIDTLHDAHAKVNMGTQKPFVKPFVKPIKEDERFYKYCSLLKSSHEVILLVAFFSFCLPLLVLPLLGFICSFCEWTRECYISCSYVRLHIVRSLPATHILSSLFSLLSLCFFCNPRWAPRCVNTLISTLDAHAHGEILPMREEREKERKREREERERRENPLPPPP